MVTQLYLAALRRAKTLKDQRTRFHRTSTNLQTLRDRRFPSSFLEARNKLPEHCGNGERVHPQLPESMASAILGNVGTLISFTWGCKMRSYSSGNSIRSSTRSMATAEIQHLLELSINGSTSVPFSAEQSLASEPNEYSPKDKRTTKQKLDNDLRGQQIIEAKIEKWLKMRTRIREFVCCYSMKS